MKSKILFLAASLAMVLQSQAQSLRLHPDPRQAVGRNTSHRDFDVPCAGSTSMASVDLRWQPILSNRHVAYEPEGPDAERIEEMKREKAILKRGAIGTGQEPLSATAVTPEMGTNFLGNLNNGSSPLDNCIAISDGGIIVSVANTTLEIDDMSGANLYYNEIVSFVNDANITAVCDPLVLYDRQADRFVFFAQECSGSSSNSKLIICFSKSNNPAVDGWWKYKLSGNPANDGSWFDYPKMAVSDQELCITGNLFDDLGSYNQSVIYQITKAAGYNGTTLSYSVWDNLDGQPFTLLPVGEGHGDNMGPGFYLVATHSGGSSEVDLYDLTDVRTGSPVIDHYTVSTTAYSPAADADQMGTSCTLDNGDCRALSGFYLNGTIHFVFHSDIGSGWNGINYNRLRIAASPTNQSFTFGSVGNYDYSYPSVAPFSSVATDKSVMIGFGRSGGSIYPQVRVVNVDNGGTFSGSVLVKQSEDYVSYTSSTNERWGDYTGIVRHHAAGAPSVWMNGMYGTPSNKWNTWIAEIHAGAVGNTPATAAATGMAVYPNPVVRTFTVEFELERKLELDIRIVDAEGRLVQDLYQGPARPGANVFSFNAAQLSPGTYFLQVMTPQQVLKNEKIVVLR